MCACASPPPISRSAWFITRPIPESRFSEFRTGLDHLEFLVERRADLDEWVAHLDALGVAHSGITEPSYTRNAMLTFRDPDNIQLEFFWRAS